MKTLRKYVLAFSSKVRNYLIPEDTNLVKLFNLGNCFGYFSRDIIEALILNILMYLLPQPHFTNEENESPYY